MTRFNRKHVNRILAAVCLLALFAVMSLYVTYQNDQDLNEAYASGSNSSECAAAILACSAARGRASLICGEHGSDSEACKDANDHADDVCDDVPSDC